MGEINRLTVGEKMELADFYYDADMAASSRPRAGLAEKLATLDPETMMPWSCADGDRCVCRSTAQAEGYGRHRDHTIEKSRQVGRSAFLAAAYGGERCIIGDKCFCGIGLRCSNWRRPTAEG